MDDLFTTTEIQWMEDYFTMFNGWQLIFDDPSQSLNTYSLGQIIDYPNFGEFEEFCMRASESVLGSQFQTFIEWYIIVSVLVILLISILMVNQKTP